LESQLLRFGLVGTVIGAIMIQASDAPLATIRLLIVTRHRLDGDALAALFSAHADFRVVCTTTSVTVASLVGRHRRPDVVLLDGSLINTNQTREIDAIVDQLGPSPILILDDELDNGRHASALRTRNMGYFTRCVPYPELADGLRRLAGGERAFSPAAGGLLHSPPHFKSIRSEPAGSELNLLTPRELEVLKLIAQGNTVKHCAELLALAPSTVDNHKSRLMKKLGVHKSLDLARLAIREGLVSL
jgi:DNA-binding NarL/FixJ family response regulator